MIDSHLDNKMEQYKKITVQFKKFFNQDELENRFNKKADIEFVNKIDKEKVSKNELQNIQEMIKGYDAKLKTISVYAFELANSMLPDRLSRKF